jgi:hypothetical protein
MKDLIRVIGKLLEEMAFAGERVLDYFKRLSGHFTEGLVTTFLAVTFAEAGDFQAVRSIIGGGPGDGGRRTNGCAAGFCTGAA